MSVLWDCFDNFRARKMNIILPVAGSGDFSRLSIISTASQRSLLPVRARTGLAGATVGPHVTWRKGGLCPSCSSVQAAYQTWQVLTACCPQSPPLVTLPNLC